MNPPTVVVNAPDGTVRLWLEPDRQHAITWALDEPNPVPVIRWRRDNGRWSLYACAQHGTGGKDRCQHTRATAAALAICRENEKKEKS